LGGILCLIVDGAIMPEAQWELDLAEEIEADPAVTVTEKRQIILARRGQGKFRERVSRIEHACRITGVNRPEHLIASHSKPWRDCESNDEREDGDSACGAAQCGRVYEGAEAVSGVSPGGGVFGGEGEGLGSSSRTPLCAETVDFNKNYRLPGEYCPAIMRSVPLPAYN